MRDFHPDDDVASPEGYSPQITPDDFDPGIPNQMLDFILRTEPAEVVDTDLFAIMKKRRSTRKFSDKPVETNKIDKIIAAADTAPTAGNFQGFEIFFITANRSVSTTSAGPDLKIKSSNWFGIPGSKSPGVS